jgi:nitrogenase molybdenum-iron protein beta chain
MREIKRLLNEMSVSTILFPDTSDVLDAPQTGTYTMYPKGGVTVEELKRTGNSKATLAMGHFASVPAAEALDAKCKVPFTELDLPIGLRATDRFIDAVRQLGDGSVPDSITDNRGRLVDIITDMEQYFYGKRVALYGDPDQLISLSEFLVDLGMRPVYVVTGTPGKYFDGRMAEILKDIPEAKYKQGAGADMFLMHQWIKNEGVDLLIGNTYGKYISRDDDIPFVRFGFPILDRVGHSYFPTVGYQGGLRLVEKMLDALLNHKDKTAPEEKVELVM